MPAKQFLGSEIALLRKTLKLSEGEFATQIGLEDRRMLKMLESGKMRPSVAVKRALFKLLNRHAGRSTKIKNLKQAIDERAQRGW